MTDVIDAAIKSPSFTGILLHNHSPYIQKVPVLLAKNRDRKNTFCGTTLITVTYGHLCPVPTHRLPGNAGTASEDTKAQARSPCPRRPICPVRFSLRSQLCGALCGCASGFTPASMVLGYVMLFIHQECPFVKRKFSCGGQMCTAERIVGREHAPAGQYHLLSRRIFTLRHRWCPAEACLRPTIKMILYQYSRTTPRTMPMISAWVPSMGS